MKLNVLIKGPSDEVQEELLIEVPSDMRTSGLIGALHRQGVLPEAKDINYKVVFEMPPDRPLGDSRLRDLDTIVVKQALLSVRIIERKPR